MNFVENVARDDDLGVVTSNIYFVYKNLWWYEKKFFGKLLCLV